MEEKASVSAILLSMIIYLARGGFGNVVTHPK